MTLRSIVYDYIAGNPTILEPSKISNKQPYSMDKPKILHLADKAKPKTRSLVHTERYDLDI